MAARLVRVFPLAEVVERLDDVLGLLTSGWRLADSRHQSLRASLQWSYDLLSQEERLLYRRLSVLPGGFGAGAAAAVFRPSRDSAAETAELSSPGGESRSSCLAPGRGAPPGSGCWSPYAGRARTARGRGGGGGDVRPTALSWLTGLCAPLHEKTYVPPATLRRIATEGENIAHLGRDCTTTTTPPAGRRAATAVLSEQDGAYSSFDVMDRLRTPWAVHPIPPLPRHPAGGRRHGGGGGR
ncbi:hypothetical protein E4K10_48190 [Streptomyces sp. T1317-0309]|nr:hypothetical protein E4K10_48190 [Streptomyces sp. T1317-0309]